jgi:hypothetical protein
MRLFSIPGTGLTKLRAWLLSTPFDLSWGKAPPPGRAVMLPVRLCAYNVMPIDLDPKNIMPVKLDAKNVMPVKLSER